MKSDLHAWVFELYQNTGLPQMWPYLEVAVIFQNRDGGYTE